MSNVVGFPIPEKTPEPKRPEPRLHRACPDEIGDAQRFLIEPLSAIRAQTLRLMAIYQDEDEVYRLATAEVEAAVYPQRDDDRFIVIDGGMA